MKKLKLAEILALRDHFYYVSDHSDDSKERYNYKEIALLADLALKQHEALKWYAQKDRPNPAHNGWQSDYSGIPSRLSNWDDGKRASQTLEIVEDE